VTAIDKVSRRESDCVRLDFGVRRFTTKRKVAVELNLGLKKVAKRTAISFSDISGLTFISTKTRDRLLDAAPWLASYFQMPERTVRPVPATGGTLDPYLRYDNPHLADLRRRYAGQPASDHIQWGTTEVEEKVDLPTFRADNLYIFQSRRYSPLALYASGSYAKEVDQLGLLKVLNEDGRFGVETIDFHGKAMSRDLLDSVIELNFLDRLLHLSDGHPLRVLDIGAGYGRLAHRMTTAFSNVKKYFCVDAVPESTFISEYYLKFRELVDRCVVVPLDELERVEAPELAVNIHSFAECKYSVVAWWIDRVRDLGVKSLFIAATPSLGLTAHVERGRKDYRELIEQAGFKLVAKEQKFGAAPMLQQQGLYPADYYLFQRS
jgi:SAM-dependent methyltransferase